MRMEYAEMPGLQLTLWQAQRLWNLSEEHCQRALGALIQSGFLVRTSAGRTRGRDRSGAAMESPQVAEATGTWTRRDRCESS